MRLFSPAFLFILTLAGSLTGCATLQSGGFTVDKSSTEHAFEVVKNRASFELECPKDKIEVTVLNAEGTPARATQIGVLGCGHKAVYVASYSGWVMNSEGGKAK